MVFVTPSFRSYFPGPEIPRVIEDISVEDVEKRRAPTKHYVYVVYVSWSSGTVSVVHRTYGDFQRFHSQLQGKFKNNQELRWNGQAIPDLPGRVFLGRDNIQKVALRRLQLLDEYCKVLINLPPVVSSSQGIVRFFQPTDLDVKASTTRASMQRKEVAGQGGPSEISTPLPNESYVAIADYEKVGADEITLKAGDSLEVFIRNESGWWLVCKGQSYGWVPFSYLEKVDGREDEPAAKIASGREEKYIALTEFESHADDEVDLDKGQVVEVLEKHLDGWWRVRYANREGMAPAVNLAKANSRKARRALEKAVTPPLTPKEDRDDLDVRLSLFESPDDDDSDSESDFVDMMSDTEINTMRARVKEGRQRQREGLGSVFSEEGKMKALRPRVSRAPPRLGSVKKTYIRPPAPLPGIVRLSSDDDEDPAEAREGTVYENIVLGDPVETHVDESEGHEYYNVSPFNRKESTKGRPQYESRSAFKGGDSGETDLTEGEVVSVLEKTGTGWWLVQSATGVGWVPSHFLKLPSNKPAEITADDLPGDEYDQTAPQKYMPKLPGGKRESMKTEGHIAFKYMQSARADAPANGDKKKDSPQFGHKKPPTAAKRTAFKSSTPSASPAVTPSHSISSTSSYASSTSSGASSGIKPRTPRKPLATPHNEDQKQSSRAEPETSSTKSVKDLKAMFSR